jgi:hypothetical protein
MSTTLKIIVALVITIFLVITAASADYPWRNPNYHAPTTIPTLTPTCFPTQEPVVLSPEPSGQDVSQYHYRVMVLDGINQTQIRMALRYIPNLFSFELVPDDPSQYEFKDGYAVPQTARLITVFNGTMHGYTHPGAMGYHYWQGRSTVVYLGQDPYPLSWIITHECLHEALHDTPINQDDLPSFAPLWNEWMQERGVGFWSGDERQYVGTGWSQLKQDFLVSQCLTL